MTQAITSITRGPRQSNFELLRIIAMFMVLTVHADFLAFGVPSYEEISTAPWSAIGRTFIEAAAVIGVNIFVMISGWFGIKPSVKGFCNFCFQVIYFYTLSLVITRLLGLNSISATNLAHIICLPENGWFIISYIGLYVLAPVLNVFLNTSSKKAQANVLISFFTIQTVYGFIGTSQNFEFGYTTVSFIGLYLLAGFVRRNTAYLSAKLGGVICYSSITCIITAIILIMPRSAIRMIAYSNPLVVISALAVVLQFNNMNIGTSKVINFIAASAFGVYLLHDNIFTVHQIYVPMMKYLGSTYGWLAIAGAMIAVFAVAVLLDQPRKIMWKHISGKCFTKM